MTELTLVSNQLHVDISRQLNQQFLLIHNKSNIQRKKPTAEQTYSIHLCDTARSSSCSAFV